MKSPYLTRLLIYESRFIIVVYLRNEIRRYLELLRFGSQSTVVEGAVRNMWGYNGRILP
jgi:hypothetical protein